MVDLHNFTIVELPDAIPRRRDGLALNSWTPMWTHSNIHSQPKCFALFAVALATVVLWTYTVIHPPMATYLHLSASPTLSTRSHMLDRGPILQGRTRNYNANSQVFKSTHVTSAPLDISVVVTKEDHLSEERSDGFSSSATTFLLPMAIACFAAGSMKRRRKSSNVEQVKVSKQEAKKRARAIKAEKEKKEIERMEGIDAQSSARENNVSMIHWFPGHVAKAEKSLKAQMAAVDVVLEVRDARIPLASSHPRLEKWMEGKKRVLVMNRIDQVSHTAQVKWDAYFRSQGEYPLWCNARTGEGVKPIIKAAAAAGVQINEARDRKGLKPRPIRCLILGMPNVGKSALINRLAGRRVVNSASRPGVTTGLQWVKMGQKGEDSLLEMLDSPGMPPPRLDDQRAAVMLAICDDIGRASYDNEDIAQQLFLMLKDLDQKWMTQDVMQFLTERYGASTDLPYLEWLQQAADVHTTGRTKNMADRLIADFRTGILGKVTLEVPPIFDKPAGSWRVLDLSDV
uniref:CP-type G domain-containing protein n=1 Tax=Eutreptiella gymnastica TaxID=73025 RepID=A0A7S1J3E9_9EUGL|mmetsp:Transcript_64056/g.114285  ORF Transcript_64056/g.114285 Transcript_64056/m.114285 type:complete len:513 (+) Transcript_64056:33-1571(+)